jgi:hypothetical protein
MDNIMKHVQIKHVIFTEFKTKIITLKNQPFKKNLLIKIIVL